MQQEQQLFEYALNFHTNAICACATYPNVPVTQAALVSFGRELALDSATSYAQLSRALRYPHVHLNRAQRAVVRSAFKAARAAA